MNNIKILEALLKDDAVTLVESIKQALTEKSVTKIKKKIQIESFAYLNESTNYKKIEQHVNNYVGVGKGSNAPKLSLHFKDGTTISLDTNTANGLVTLHSSVGHSTKKQLENRLDQSLASYMQMINYGKRKGYL